MLVDLQRLLRAADDGAGAAPVQRPPRSSWSRRSARGCGGWPSPTPPSSGSPTLPPRSTPGAPRPRRQQPGLPGLAAGRRAQAGQGEYPADHRGLAPSCSTSATSSAPAAQALRISIEVCVQEREALEGRWRPERRRGGEGPAPTPCRTSTSTVRGRVLARRARDLLVHADQGLQGLPAPGWRAADLPPGGAASWKCRSPSSPAPWRWPWPSPRAGCARPILAPPRGRLARPEASVGPDALRDVEFARKPTRGWRSSWRSSSSAPASRWSFSAKRREEDPGLQKLIKLSADAARTYLPGYYFRRSRSTSSSRPTARTARSSALPQGRPPMSLTRAEPARMPVQGAAGPLPVASTGPSSRSTRSSSFFLAEPVQRDRADEDDEGLPGPDLRKFPDSPWWPS